MIRISGTVNRTTKDGVVIGGNQRINAEEAIRAYTAGEAYTSFEENQKGHIMAGQ